MRQRNMEKKHPIATPAQADTPPKLLNCNVRLQVLPTQRQGPHLSAILPFPVQQLVFGNAFL